MTYKLLSIQQVNRPKKPRKGTVQHTFIVILHIFYLNSALAQGPLTLKNLPLKKEVKAHILKGEIYANSEVESIVLAKDKAGNTLKGQSLKFKTSGLHTRSCRFALRKLSKYENFKNYLDFVKESSYDEKQKRINLLLSSKILPFDMRLNFVLPRITKPGIYDFEFDKGFLLGLKGKIHVGQYKNRCLFYTIADWKGPKTKIPNMVFEFFSTTISKMAMKSLFRISKTY